MTISASSVVSRRGLLAGLSVVTFATSLATLAASPDPQGPVFRSSVDLVAVDVQVVDRDGNPIERLTPQTFDVTINGRRRKVVSAEFIRQAAVDATTLSRIIEPLPAVLPVGADARDGRLFIIAIDNGSFEPGTTTAMVESVDHSVQHLEPTDRVGLYVYPTGPKLEPTTERAKVRAALAQVNGEKNRMQSRYSLKPSEIVDITAALSMGVRTRLDAASLAAGGSANDVVTEVARRECPEDPDCVASLLNDVAALAPHLESQAETSLTGLGLLLRGLSTLPGRKAVLFVSGGLLVSDRSDGRPDVGDMSKVLGQTAAQANATVYTIQIDPGSPSVRSSSRRASGVETNRDRQLLGDWLDNFSAAAGGMRLFVQTGGGDFAFDRVLRETAAHYLLGVEPEDTDRDGRPRELKVKLPQQRGVTVHSRQWVVIPVKTNS